jgi:anti-sigma B factor antagonist
MSFESRRVGHVTVVTCSGRMVAGTNTAALQQYLDELLPLNPRLVLHLGGIEFIDSAGLGLLVRYLTRAQNAGGAMTVCAVSPKVDEVLTVTRLRSVFRPSDTEVEAIQSAHRGHRGAGASTPQSNVLCVDKSSDLLAYLRQLLKEAGYQAMTAANLPDALTLMTATHPRVVVISAELRASRGTRTAEEFHRLAAAGTVVELPPGFGGRDAGDAAQEILNAIRASVEPDAAIQ